MEQSPAKPQEIWVLVDNYIGNSNQARALAGIMGWSEAVEQKLEYSIYGALPNILQFGFSSITQNCASRMCPKTNICPPKIIISAGRRAGHVATALKRHYPRAKLLQVLNPECSLQHFAAIILPEHDRKPNQRYPSNVIFVPGALAHFDSGVLTIAAQELQTSLKLKSPYITLLIGGGTPNTPFTRHEFIDMWNTVIENAERLQASLLISTSRRTAPDILSMLEAELPKLKIPYYCYTYGSEEINPYKGMLGLANYLVATADSVSMCSECCSTGKPVYIYLASNAPVSKHRRFVESLFANGAARPLGAIEQFESATIQSYAEMQRTILCQLSL